MLYFYQGSVQRNSKAKKGRVLVLIRRLFFLCHLLQQC